MTKDEQNKIDLFNMILNSLEKRIPNLDRTLNNKENCKRILKSLLVSAENFHKNKLITSEQFKKYYDRILIISNTINKF